MQKQLKNKYSYAELEAENLRLRTELTNLKRLIFGQKRERFIPEENDNQLSFLNQAVSSESISKTEEISYTRAKRSKKANPPSRQLLPAHFKRNKIIIEPEEDTTGMKKIGEEITEELEYEPGKFYVNRYVRPKYALPEDKGIAIGLLPTRPIEKGIAGPGLLAHINISKFVDHLPLYRQQQQFKRLGIALSASTLCGWVRSTYELTKPLVDLMRKQVLQSGYLMADETPIKVQDAGIKGKNHQGYYWVYYDPLSKQIFFDYKKRRERDGPNQILKDFKGYLQTDGYAGYNDLGKRKGITPMGCMAHARRKFVEAQESDPERAGWMLHHIQILYKIERNARDNHFSYKKRYHERQQYSAVAMGVIKNWLDVESMQVRPKSAIGKAIAYMLKQWPRLEVYLTDGKLEIDNNLVENAIRPIALGRKNYLFAGSHDGAEWAAAIYTLVTNAKLQGVEPFTYLRDILDRISDHPCKKLDQLLPENFKEQYVLK
ncbi:MAG: IS66 family transposase [Acidobacteriota bacterium]|nr:IS66 family transposase [Acidobacteriota bacterium]